VAEDLAVTASYAMACRRALEGDAVKGQRAYDAIVIGSGPNGLAAAVTLARAGRSVLVYEAQETIGGGVRSAALTLPGFVHDVCSSIHPLAVASPFFRSLPLSEYGLEWVYSPAALAHPFDDGTAALLERAIEETASTLGKDAAAYQQLMTPLVASWDRLEEAVLGPLRAPRHPLALLRFSWRALRSARGVADRWFAEEPARGFFAGLAAHAIMPLERLPSAAFGLMLGMLGHIVGWPFPRGGAQRISEALAAYLRTLGGEIRTGTPIASLDELPAAGAVLCDVTPRQLLQIAGHRLPGRYRRQLQRYRYGPAAFKVDWALAGPIPWIASACARAATVHVGGTLAEIAASERAAWQGRPTEHPFVLVAQHSLFDPTRAPPGQHTAWAYCHVPHGSPVDMTDRIERQIERFAPGFRERILARSVLPPAGLERYNPNYVGGDINGGVQDLWQLFTRPTMRLVPYATAARGLYICSSSTPPGGGVHGLCGYFAAHAALRGALRA
jgi:phytoene dehydrogenase-like protein